MVPFIVVDGAEETGGIRLHPVIEQLMTKMNIGGKWTANLGPRTLKPSLKRLLRECIVYDNRDLNYNIYKHRWDLLRIKYDNPELAQFIPNFVVLQQNDVNIRFDVLYRNVYYLGEDEYNAAVNRVEAEEREQLRREQQERWEQQERLAAEDEAAQVPRRRSNGRYYGGRLNRRTKKKSHGLPKSKAKSKAKSKSKSKKSKKYNKTKSI